MAVESSLQPAIMACNCSEEDVMFKTRAAVFYRDLKPRGAAECL